MKIILTIFLLIAISGCSSSKKVWIKDTLPEIFLPKTTEQLIVTTDENGNFSKEEIEKILILIIKLRQENEILIHNINIFNEYRINREKIK